MEVKKLSASSYKKWAFCEHAFFIENVLNYHYPAGKAASIGTITHAILESLAEIKLAQQRKLVEVDIDGVGTLKSFDPIDVVSLSEQIYAHQTQNVLNTLKWEKADLTTVKRHVNKAITHNNGIFNPLNRTIIQTEQYIKIKIDEDWAILPSGGQLNITGFIDLVTKVDENTIEIIDWKTGSQLKDFLSGQELNYENIRNDIQLRMYHLAASKIYGEDKSYMLTMFFTNFGKVFTYNFSVEDIKYTKELIKKKFLEIHGCKIPRRSITWKCRKFCDYAKNTRSDSPIQFIDNQITAVGDKMCLCDQVYYEVNRRGLQWTVENMSNDSK